MAVSWTSRGISRFTNWLDGGTAPTTLRLRLTTDVPTWATKAMSELSEIPTGNGYSPINVNPGSTNWSGETENDDDDARYLERRLRERGWDASGGDIPTSGDGFEAVILTDNATDPAVIAYIDLGRARTILDGTSLTIPSLALRFAEGSLPRGIGGDVASLPQQAYLQQVVVTNTWYEVLDYTTGGGYFHSVRLGNLLGPQQGDFRITVDGNAATLEGDNNNVDGRTGGFASTVLAAYEGTIRFDSSLKVEFRQTSGTGTRHAKCYYSTDL